MAHKLMPTPLIDWALSLTCMHTRAEKLHDGLHNALWGKWYNIKVFVYISTFHFGFPFSWYLRLLSSSTLSPNRESRFSKREESLLPLHPLNSLKRWLVSWWTTPGSIRRWSESILETGKTPLSLRLLLSKLFWGDCVYVYTWYELYIVYALFCLVHEFWDVSMCNMTWIVWVCALFLLFILYFTWFLSQAECVCLHISYQ